MYYEDIRADFLIIGSGVAGLRAAIELAGKGEITVVTKDIMKESSTEYAQGGVAVALSDEDEVGIHYEDTIRAGDGLCIKPAVEVLVSDGPWRIRELIDWGAEFDRLGTRLDFTLEAAHSRRRVLHAHGDSTGSEIVKVLLSKVITSSEIKRLTFSVAVDLMVHDGRCLGALILREGKLYRVFAKATLLASGGGGQVFARTTNPEVATGDGMAIAWRAGAVLRDMEFVQFHPTALYAPGAPQFLLSEAMRGEGGRLLNIYGEPFMKKYHPDGELAPRDVVSRAIISEMVETKSTHVYLDLTHLDGGFIKKRFPRIYHTCLRYDIDITRDRVPVSPAAHYMMGGVMTDRDGRTSIEGLFAAGEVTCTGVHGANRLASNSLLEGLVFGARAGMSARDYACKREDPFHEINLSGPGFKSIENYNELRSLIRRVMWERVGIIRCSESLGMAKERLGAFRGLLEGTYLTRREVEVKNMLQTGLLITEAAFRRECSIGAHYRSDRKDREGCRYHLLMKREDDGRMRFWEEPCD